MGGNHYYTNTNTNSTKQNKSSSSFFGLFKIKRNRPRVDEYYGAEEAPSNRRVWPSDEDKGRWPVAMPGIDRRAEDFIAKIHRNIATDSEPKTVTLPSSTIVRA